MEMYKLLPERDIMVVLLNLEAMVVMGMDFIIVKMSKVRQ
jgi:hypothetical protein